MLREEAGPERRVLLLLLGARVGAPGLERIRVLALDLR